jgi:hypothetical protein
VPEPAIVPLLRPEVRRLGVEVGRQLRNGEPGRLWALLSEFALADCVPHGLQEIRLVDLAPIPEDASLLGSRPAFVSMRMGRSTRRREDAADGAPNLSFADDFRAYALILRERGIKLFWGKKEVRT